MRDQLNTGATSKITHAWKRYTPCLYVTHATRALESHWYVGRKLTQDHKHTFLNTQGQGGPPRMRDQLITGATFEKTQAWKTMHTNHVPIYSIMANMKGWLWRPNDIRGPVGLKLPDIYLTGEEKPRKTSPRKLVLTGDRINVHIPSRLYSEILCIISVIPS